MSQRNMGRQPGPGKVRAVCCIRSAVGHVPGLGLYGGLLVKSRVGEVDVFRVHLFLAKPQTLAKPLEVHDLPLPKEADNVVDVRIVGKAQNVVISEAGFLFCCDGVRTTFLEAVIFIVQTAFK